MYDIDDPGKESWASLPNHCWGEDELVDFPCSDDFLHHYHSKGMTPRCPEPNVQAQLSEMTSRLERLEASIRSISKSKVKPVYIPTPVAALPEPEWAAVPKSKKATKGVG